MSIILNGTKLGSRITFNNINLSEIIFNGISVWKSLPSSLEAATWDEIKTAIQNGTFTSFASVGDTKSFVMNGKIYHAEVVAINDGTGDAGGWYPNETVDFICKELYETEYRYNDNSTNEGGFPSSSLKNTLTDTIYPLLPSDLKGVIIEKSHLYNVNTSGTMGIASTKLWLPTYYEIFGTSHQYAPGETASNNKAYSLASKVKESNIWWLGSLYSGLSQYFWNVGGNGGAYYSGATGRAGVPICFRIGADTPVESLEDATWQQISDSIKNGTFSQFASVGDTKSFEINGKTYHAEVVSINDGTGDASSWYPNNTVDFICTELYETTYQYNSTNVVDGGFPSSALRGTLINTIYPLLPSDLKNVIIAKSHSYNISVNGTMATDSTNLWLPTRFEIDGGVNNQTPGENGSNNKIYTLSSKIKNKNGGSVNNWWLGSLYAPAGGGNSTSFWIMGSNGKISINSASLSGGGVPICFRLG